MLYALHALEVEYIGKGKTGNPYNGYILHKQLEQTQMLLEGTESTPKQVITGFGFLGVDTDNP